MKLLLFILALVGVAVGIYMAGWFKGYNTCRYIHTGQVISLRKLYRKWNKPPTDLRAGVKCRMCGGRPGKHATGCKLRWQLIIN